MTAALPYFPGLSHVAPRYDAFIIDIWGVVHDGVTLYPGVVDSLTRLQDAGKPVVLLSNAPRRGDAIAEAMMGMGVPENLCRNIMSSGESTWRHLHDRDDPWYAVLGKRCYHIGPDRDDGIFGGLSLTRVETVAAADFIVNTGPWEDEETVDGYEALLQEGASHKLPMVCANPDLEVIRGGKRVICAGALAARYEELGGDVSYLGKPKPAIYDDCFALLGPVQRSGVVAIGDSLRTDIAGANAVGIDSILVVSGLLADEMAGIGDESLLTQRIFETCQRAGQMPTAAMPGLIW